MWTNNARRIALLSVMALCACTTVPPASVPVTVECPRLSPPPASVMVERPANFRERLLRIFSTSSTTPTSSPGSSPSARTSFGETVTGRSPGSDE